MNLVVLAPCLPPRQDAWAPRRPQKGRLPFLRTMAGPDPQASQPAHGTFPRLPFALIDTGRSLTLATDKSAADPLHRLTIQVPRNCPYWPAEDENALGRCSITNCLCGQQHSARGWLSKHLCPSFVSAPLCLLGSEVAVGPNGTWVPTGALDQG